MTSSARAGRRHSAAPLTTIAALLALGACHRGAAPVGTASPTAARDSIQVGYGTEARRNVTGSISSIDGEAQPRGTATTMADLLEGKVPGLEVRRLGNGDVSVRIRGDRSLKADGEPLYVVDGIPMNGRTIMTDLDPREVKSVEVLKEAGSLAAYGSRGANGVILIRLKKPPKP